MPDVPVSAGSVFVLLALGLTLGTCWLVCKPLMRAGAGGESPSISRWTAIWLSAAAVAGVSLSYLRVGQWRALDIGPGWQQAEPAVQPLALSAAPGDPSPPSSPPASQQDIPGLIAHLRSNPGDVAAWKRLAQGCEQAGLLPEAASAYKAWAKLTTGDADTFAQYAVTLAMSKGQGLSGEPEALIQRALKLSPRHEAALGLAAEAALERHDDLAAMGYFKRLEAVLPPASSERAPLQERMAALAKRLGR